MTWSRTSLSTLRTSPACASLASRSWNQQPQQKLVNQTPFKINMITWLIYIYIYIYRPMCIHICIYIDIYIYIYIYPSVCQSFLLDQTNFPAFRTIASRPWASCHIGVPWGTDHLTRLGLATSQTINPVMASESRTTPAFTKLACHVGNLRKSRFEFHESILFGS